jgi:hypothetical protein
LGKTYLQIRNRKDLYGFNRSLDYLASERQHLSSTTVATNKRDLDFLQYMKGIGGTDNIKGDGVFKASKELKQLVRRGIPAAYRASVWIKISLSDVYKSSFPAFYYQTLVSRSESEVAAAVKFDIEKDIDRTFPEHGQ